jgi:TonB family protein
MGKRFMTSMRGLVGGRKSEPVYEFVPRVARETAAADAVIEGELRSRPVVSKPAHPSLPEDAPRALRSAEVEILFTVDPLGAVASAEIASSSGDDRADLLWAEYLKSWQFAPQDLRRPSGVQTGRARFKLSPDESES